MTGARQPDAILETTERLTEADIANLRAQVRVDTYREISDEVERRGFPLLAASLRRVVGDQVVHACTHDMIDVLTAEEIGLTSMVSHLKCLRCGLHLRDYRGDPA